MNKNIMKVLWVNKTKYKARLCLQSLKSSLMTKVGFFVWIFCFQHLSNRLYCDLPDT